MSTSAKLFEKLHPATKEVLSNIGDFKGPQFLVTHKAWNAFNEKPNRKRLERLVHAVHFNVLNERPHHLDILRSHMSELAKFWPYEFYHSVIRMKHPEIESQKVLWTRNNERALDLLKFDRHKWLQKKKWERVDVEKVKQNTSVDGNLEIGSQSDIYRLSEETREHTLRIVFSHFMFLKKNASVCGTKKLPIPIVEIGLKPDGFDIPDVRIDNLFKKKVSEVASILIDQNPVLSTRAEILLQNIITDPSVCRSVRRLYQKVCLRAYVLRNDQFLLSELARAQYSSHLISDERFPLNLGGKRSY